MSQPPPGKITINTSGDPAALAAVQQIMKETNAAKGCVHVLAILAYIAVLGWIFAG